MGQTLPVERLAETAYNPSLQTIAFPGFRIDSAIGIVVHCSHFAAWASVVAASASVVAASASAVAASASAVAALASAVAAIVSERDN